MKKAWDGSSFPGNAGHPAFFMMAPAFQAWIQRWKRALHQRYRKGRVFFQITLPFCGRRS